MYLNLVNMKNINQIVVKKFNNNNNNKNNIDNINNKDSKFFLKLLMIILLSFLIICIVSFFHIALGSGISKDKKNIVKNVKKNTLNASDVKASDVDAQIQKSIQPLIKNALSDLSSEKKIVVIAPASGTTMDKLNALRNALPKDVIFPGNDVFSSEVPYNSNLDDKRFTELKNVLYDDNVDIIWALRGGYGSARLFDQLKTLKHKPKKEKIIIGYSDITFMHIFFSEWGWKSIHGFVMLEELDQDKDPKNFTLVSDFILCKTSENKPHSDKLYYKDVEPLNNAAKKAVVDILPADNNVSGGVEVTKKIELMHEKKIEGELIGGNLTLISNSIGTEYQINPKNKILFIEDVKSSGYVIDRDLTHLKQSGILKDLKAIVLGDFIGDDNNIDYAIQRFAKDVDNTNMDTIQKNTSVLNIPVFRFKSSGHGYKNYPLPFGYRAMIKNGTLEIYNSECTANTEVKYK